MNAAVPADLTRTKREIASIFGRAALTYDRVGPRFFSHFGRRLVEFADIPSGARVLDVATGRGAALFPAAEAVGPLGRVTGIDLSDAMVRKTADDIRARGLDRVDVIRMDAERLRFADGSFDRVLCGFALFLFPRLERAMAEMSRVLKPGGRLAVTTWDAAFDDEWRWFDDLVEASLPPRDAEEAPGEPEDSLTPRLDTPDGVGDVMRAAGLCSIEVTREDVDFVYAGEEEWWSSLWSHGKREDLEAIEQAGGADGLARFRASVLRRLQTARRSDGIHQLFPALLAAGAKPRAGPRGSSARKSA